MRPLPLLLPLLALPLAACGPKDVKVPGAYNLSGTLGGDWGPNPRLRLALVGVGFPSAVANSGNLPQNVVPKSEPNSWSFGLDLPRSPKLATVAGVYQVIAYNDRDNTGTYDVGEPFARNQQWLIYSALGGEIPAVEVGGTEVTPKMKVVSGWNLYDRRQPLGSGNPQAVERVTGYDLSR